MNKPRKSGETNGAAYRRPRGLEANHKSLERATQMLETFVPRTQLGRRLLQIRRRILAAGQPLLDWDDIAGELPMVREIHRHQLIT
jgi:hypothetical protein